LSAVASVSFYFSLEYLELDDAVTVGMAGPIFVAMLSGWYLGERVPALRWIAIVAGFAGVAVVMRPGAGLFNIWALLALVSAASYAVAVMLSRRLTATEDSLTILFYLSVVAGLALAPIMPFVWSSTPLQELPLLFMVGFLAGITQYLLIQAYRYGVANTIITFDYMGIIYIGIVAYLAFAEIPGWNLLAGAVLLVGSGLYIVYDEARQHQRRTEELGG
jgi:drug/metabolite transporter (DMT)-like permease